MYWTGNGIASTLVKIQPDYRVRTTLALKWVQVANGNWMATDRTYTSDIYETEFEIMGKQAYVQSVIDLIDVNRFAASTTHLITVSGCTDTEHVFGEDVDHSSVNMTVLEVGPLEQRTWQVYGVTVRARAVSPSFIGTPALPAFKHIPVGRSASVASTLNKQDTYYGLFTHIEHDSDVGVAELSVILSVADCQAFRRQLATTRGGTYTMPATSGVWTIFGPTRPEAVSVKIIDWEDTGWFGITHRIMKLTIAEVV